MKNKCPSQKILRQVLKAKQHGVNVNSYCMSFTGNFEWADGYKPRFGLIHIGYNTQKRTIKSSGYWYGNFLQSPYIRQQLQIKEAV